jgi:hypothetical protein
VLAVVVALVALVGVLLTRRTSERQFAQRQKLDRAHFAQAQEVDRIQGLRERHTVCAAQLAHDKPAVRQAGIYALVTLANYWNNTTAAAEATNSGLREIQEEARVCLDLLCACLRSSKEPEDEAVRRPGASVIERHLATGKYRYDLHGANLSGTHLNGADLTRANLGEADLSGADLTGADLTGIRYDELTRWPKDFTAREKAHGRENRR